jgi:hypothetical protein
MTQYTMRVEDPPGVGRLLYMRGLLMILTIAALGGPAHAGLDGDDNEAMRPVETFARDKMTAEAVDRGYGFLCVELDAEHPKARIEPAPVSSRSFYNHQDRALQEGSLVRLLGGRD